jgi:transposase
MRTLSLDLRERILASYDNEEGSRQEIADRYRVSLGMVKKLLQQRKRTGEIGPRHHCSRRKPMIVAAHHHQLQALLSQKPDMTLKELREAVELKCSLPAIHYALEEMGLTYKKKTLREYGLDFDQRFDRRFRGNPRLLASPQGAHQRYSGHGGLCLVLIADDFWNARFP